REGRIPSCQRGFARESERMKQVVFFIFLGGCAAFGGALAVSVGPQLKAQFPAGGSPAAELAALSDRFESVARSRGPAVVSVEAVKPSGGNKPDGKARTVEDSGSGVLVAADDGRGALVVTNNHVITGAASAQVSINLPDGRLLR